MSDYDMPARSSLVLVGLACFLAAIGTAGWQFYVYLKTAAWPSISLIKVLQWAKIQWAFIPDSWYGLYHLLDKFPLSACLLVVGILMMIFGAAIK